MNLNPDRKLTTLLFNPSVYIAGAQALLLGVIAILVAGLIGYAANTHFDGVLAVHHGAAAPLWRFLSEGIIDWLCLAVVLWIFGRIVSKTSFRTIDVLGTQALARWPTLFIALITLPRGFHRFLNYLADRFFKPGAKAELSVADAAVFSLVLLGIILFTCWMVALMYKAYSVSCNVKGGKAIGTFIGGLIVAEILSEIAVYALLSFGGVNTGFGAQTVPPKSEAEAAAVSAAQSWLSVIDQGNYAQSWNEAAPAFREKVSQEKWVSTMETYRKPLGNLISRQLKSAQSATHLPDAPAGQYVVIQFNASFAEKKSAIETITVELGKDGTWAASGYFMK